MKIADIQNKDTNYDWLYQDSIDINGKTLDVKPIYQSNVNKEFSYSAEYFLIGNNIITAISKGVPTVEDIKNGSRLLSQIIKNLGGGDYYFIWDISQIKKLGAKIRKKILEEKVNHSSDIKFNYLIVSNTLNMLFKLYLIVHPDKVGNTRAKKNIESALKHVLEHSDFDNLDSQKYIPPYQSTKTELLKLSKEELVDKVMGMEKMHNERLLQIFNSIGKISWDASFKPIFIDVSNDDPYYDLINVINLIQHDVHDIISDLIDLNQNLEMKVAERIVDIMDKESNLRAILDNSDSETWLINSRFELIDFNHHFYKTFIKKNESKPEVNKNIINLLDNEEERIKWESRYKSALAGKPGIFIDEINDEGSLKIVEVKTFPIKEVGKIKGVSIFVKDITDLKRSELKLIQKNRDLEKVNSELDSFVYRVSHDLRAPLTSILGLINLQKIETDPEKQNYYMSLQEKSVSKLDNFIQDIINLSRNSRQEIAVEKIGFEELIKYILEGQYFSEYANIIEKKVNIDSSTDFFSDRKRLGIILNNLVSNGIKYCDPRRDSPFIEINVKSDREKAIIEVRDNGTGIAEDHINKIFTMFYRAHQDNSGSGLGLYIVKETVDKIFGRVSVKSKLREGSVFTLTIPNLKELKQEIVQ